MEGAIRWLEDSVQGGSSRAQHLLGQCLQYGIGTEQDAARAAELYRNAAEQGHVPAILALAECYELGIGTEQDKASAYLLYKKAAKAGDADGFYHLGRCLLRGIGTGRDAANAFAALSRAAHDGSLRALLLLADCHRTGTGTQLSPMLCRSFLEKAANGQVRQPPSEAQKLETVTFYPHPDKLAIAEALFRLGQFHATGVTDAHDFSLALECYGRAIIEGNPDAMDEMARIQSYGKGIDGYYRDMPSGSTLPATDARRMEAVNHMGDLWFFGQGLPKNEAMAVKCFKIAADGGNVAANYSLGWCEKHGKGMSKDPAQAVKHLRIAANAGNVHACFSLAECYESGEGVAERNLREAIALYKKAAAKGHAGAAKKLAELEK